MIFLNPFTFRAKIRLTEQKQLETVPDIEKNSKIQETYRHMRVTEKHLVN